MMRLFRKTIFLLILSLSVSFSASLPSSAQSALSGLLSSSPTAASNSSAPTDPLNRTTPSGSVLGFLQAAQSGNYSIAAQYLQMSSARRQSDGEDIANKLNFVMNHACNCNLSRVSNQPEGTPQEGAPFGIQKIGTMSSGDIDADLNLVRVTDPNAGKIWLISSETLTKVPELYDQVEARQVESRLPKILVKNQIAGMALWQWLALLLALPVAAGIGWLVLVVLEVPVRWWARRRGHVEIANWRTVSAPAWLLAGTLVHEFFSRYLGIALLPRHYYHQVASVALVIGATWILWHIVRWSLRRVRNRALAHGHAGTGSLMLLGERIVKAMIFVGGVLAVLGSLGFNMSTALAGLGIGGLAIGFGAQQTIANLFGGVSVLGDEVIRVGDVCRFGDRTGTVEDIGLRSTRVRTDERTLLAIPNGTVATINVENLSRRDKILFKTVLGLHPDTSPDHVRSVLAEIRNVLASQPKVEANTARVRLTEVTPSAINMELVCYVLTRDFDEFATARESMLLRIMKFVEDSGTNLASASQTLYLSGDPGAKSKIDAAVKSTTSTVAEPADRQLPESAPSNPPRNSGDKAGKDD